MNLLISSFIKDLNFKKYFREGSQATGPHQTEGVVPAAPSSLHFNRKSQPHHLRRRPLGPKTIHRANLLKGIDCLSCPFLRPQLETEAVSVTTSARRTEKLASHEQEI
jgi:hypothetical protein